jgi:hypothetical protein
MDIVRIQYKQYRLKEFIQLMSNDIIQFHFKCETPIQNNELTI